MAAAGGDGSGNRRADPSPRARRRSRPRSGRSPWPTTLTRSKARARRSPGGGDAALDGQLVYSVRRGGAERRRRAAQAVAQDDLRLARALSAGRAGLPARKPRLRPARHRPRHMRRGRLLPARRRGGGDRDALMLGDPLSGKAALFAPGSFALRGDGLSEPDHHCGAHRRRRVQRERLGVSASGR